MSRALSLFSLLSVLAAPVFSTGQEPPQVKRPVVNDERFEERMHRSYAPVDAPEPPVTQLEQEILDKAYSLLESNQQYAFNFLKEKLDAGVPVSAAFNNAIGNIYFQNRNYFLAETQYLAAITKYPNFQRAWNGLGFAQYLQENYKDAAQSLAISVQHGARDATTYGVLGYCYLKMGRYRSAEIAYNFAVLSEPEETDWAEGIAQIYYDTGRYEEAISVFDDLIRARPDSSEYWLLKANAWLELEKPQKTAACIEIARRIEKLDADTLYLLGNIYLDQGIYHRAREVFVASASESGRVDPSAALKAVRYLAHQGQHEFAEEIFGLIASEEEDWRAEDKSLYRFLAGEFAYFKSDMDRSEASYLAGLELEPFNGYALLKLADIKERQGDPDQALIYLDRAQADPAFKYNALVSKAMLLIHRERFRYALKTIEEAMAVKSDERMDRLYAQVKRVVESDATQPFAR